MYYLPLVWLQLIMNGLNSMYLSELTDGTVTFMLLKGYICINDICSVVFKLTYAILFKQIHKNTYISQCDVLLRLVLTVHPGRCKGAFLYLCMPLIMPLIMPHGPIICTRLSCLQTLQRTTMTTKQSPQG